MQRCAKGYLRPYNRGDIYDKGQDLCNVRKGSKADFAIMHERLAHASKEKDIIEYNPPGYSSACYSLHGINAFTRFY
ncbi:hypothetical protein L249_6906 [Ophiocordyceps polyrhachis-furcata BCC 54312]|uniref:Uncharacterized protein n=1 Tax=Ophiocordyceps polyrhachis-furcata BCC 54312 TaxID=1330021 RepID=A0A367LLG2_9HYPO|nr:hypothetical protein L249_6906 [Ophiocordyceps polyrhachis-furcata BCC 54312]